MPYYYKGYPIYLSDKKPKKYFAIVNNKKIYFGDQRYQQYHDKIGYYSILDHWDKNRRASYKKRHINDIGNKGKAGWFAYNILW